MMSPHESGGQWDTPTPGRRINCWRTTASGGMALRMMRIGFRMSFSSTVAENFRRDGTIREKYNAVTRSSETAVTAGYQMNIVGFGWTNGVFLVLLNELPPEAVARLATEQNAAPAGAAR